MKIYFSVKQIPEIAALNKQERLAVLLYFRRTHFGSTHIDRFVEFALIGFLILAEIAGFIGGWFYWRGFWGSVAGAVLAMWFVLAVYFIVDANVTIPKLKRFLQSEYGQKEIETLKKYVAEASKRGENKDAGS